MRIVLTRLCRTRIAVAAVALVALAVAPAAAHAAPATGGEPTSTPIPAGRRVVSVVNDLNGDGVHQDSEPALPGWRLTLGCTDAVIGIETNAAGEASAGSPDQGECIRLNRPFGWLPTNPATTTVRVDAGVDDVNFLVRDLGDHAMEITGEAIVRGLPAQSLAVTAAAPYESCVGSFLDVSSWYSSATVIVSDSAADASCPDPGSAVTVVLEGDTAAAITVPFSPGQTVSRDLVARGGAMRITGVSLTAAKIGGVECAVILQPPPGAFLPGGIVTAFVLSEEVRAGCGAPGRLVEFYRDGRLLTPPIPWVAARPDEPIEFAFAPDTPTTTPRPPVVLPRTGSGVGSRSSSLSAIAVGLTLTGCGAIAAAAGARSSVRPRC
jgi:hypothetical protein